MTLNERIVVFEFLFEELQSTNSRIEKDAIVKVFEKTYPELKEDWTYILETLDGKHPIGWTFTYRFRPYETNRDDTPYEPEGIHTIKDLIRYCEDIPDRSIENTYKREYMIGIHGQFLEPIVNRTLRLGIGKSLLEKTNTTPMLAKKYEGQMLHNDVIVTEKLDGNRCLAIFNKDTNKWEFKSRSGKAMNVNFDMTGMNTNLIYDGEVMSLAQTQLSEKRYRAILNDERFDETNDTQKSQLLFNETSGMINRHGAKSGLIYNVFDIVSDAKYTDRRNILQTNDFVSPDIRLLPVLYEGTDVNYINGLLDKITQMGGEGVMLNMHNRGYEHKRSDALLKYKQVQHIDMVVIGIIPGTGKYEGMVGALHCYIRLENGREILCDVGSGLSDAQRFDWSIEPNKIIGKIIQVGYHELTQDREDIGTNLYSLRFPRLVCVRGDKIETSEY